MQTFFLFFFVPAQKKSAFLSQNILFYIFKTLQISNIRNILTFKGENVKLCCFFFYHISNPNRPLKTALLLFEC